MSHCEMCSLIRALSSRLRCFVTSSSRKVILIFLTIVVSHRLQLSTGSHVRLLHPPLHLVHHILRCPLAILQRCRDRRLHVSKHCWHPLRLPIRHDYPGTMTDFTKKTAVELKKLCKEAKVAISGTKAMMIARLVKKETDTAQATEQTAPATGQTATATPNLAGTTKKISGAGLRAVSPVRDHATSLMGQHALNVTLLPLSDYDRSWWGVR
jgi:hypothetical protein